MLAEQITAVRVDSGNGDVILRGEGAATEVAIHRLVRYRGSRPDDPTHQVENGVLVLGGCGRGCSVDYTVDLPAGLPVTGKTSNGTVSLSGMGDVDITTRNGAVTLNELAGAVTVRTNNGQIDGHGLSGERIEAHTSNGAINLTLAAPQSVRAKTSNGDITLSVPDADYHVSTQARKGKPDIQVANNPAGEYQLDLTTRNGSITVKPA